MARRRLPNITINIGGMLFGVAGIVALFKVMETGDLMQGFGIFLEGIAMSVGVILCIIPYFNLFVLANIAGFIAENLVIWGVTGSWHTALVFAIGFLEMIFITVIIDLIVTVILWNYFMGNKQAVSKMIRGLFG